MSVLSIMNEVIAELKRARGIFPPFNSAHEGYAVILEELDELWACVKTKGNPGMRKEAIQLAAMALRFLDDVCGEAP